MFLPSQVAYTDIYKSMLSFVFADLLFFLKTMLKIKSMYM